MATATITAGSAPGRSVAAAAPALPADHMPVRIDVPADVRKTGKLRAGLSVVVDVDSRTAPGAVALN